MNFNDFSALCRILLVFVIMFAGIRKKMSVTSMFSAGSILMAVLFCMPAKMFLCSAADALMSGKTISLAAMVSLIIVFGGLMEKTGITERIGDVFRKSGADMRIGLAAFPAIIGLLPVPGGAVFSAPMVKRLAHGHEIEASGMSLINYWYRHIWEYLWPLYPGILLASSISGMGLGIIAIYMTPFTLMAILLGLNFLPEKNIGAKPENNKKAKGLLAYKSGVMVFVKGIGEIFPLLIVVVPATVISPILSGLSINIPATHEITLTASLSAGIFYLIATNWNKPEKIRISLIDKRIPEMIFMVVSIMIFKKILEDTGAASAIGKEIDSTGVPVYIAAVIIPFITGIVTGISVAFVGISLPVILSIAKATGNTAMTEPLTVLAISSGFMGVMLSPLHLCLILSNSYFKADHSYFYRKLYAPCLSIIIFGFIYFHILVMLCK